MVRLDILVLKGLTFMLAINMPIGVVQCMTTTNKYQWSSRKRVNVAGVANPLSLGTSVQVC